MNEREDFKIKWSPISPWQRIGSPSQVSLLFDAFASFLDLSICFMPGVCFSESTLETKKSSPPRPTSNHVFPQAKAVPKSQPAARGAATNRALPAVRPASKFTDSKVKNLSNTLGSVVITQFHVRIKLSSLGLFLAQVSPQAGKDQNGKTSGVKPPRRDMKNFKNVDSKLANLILNEIVDRYLKKKILG